MRTIVVVDYHPRWPDTFERLRAHIWPAVDDVALAIEHVGSTSVPGLAAKPTIDLSVVVPTDAEIAVAIDRLASLGYAHRGNLGIDGREAFDSDARLPRHNLYLCARGGLALANHLAVREYLRLHPDVAHGYGELKKRLASKFPHDIDSYVDGKTGMILEILRAAGLPAEGLAAIARANRKGSLLKGVTVQLQPDRDQS